MPFQNQECVLHLLLLTGFDAVGLVDWIGPDEHGETEGACRGPHTTQEGSRSGGEFFDFFRCNPLKSPDSTKGIQGNASFFPWFSLDFLARSLPASCIQG
jgi:hypothetical protein